MLRDIDRDGIIMTRLDRSLGYVQAVPYDSHIFHKDMCVSDYWDGAPMIPDVVKFLYVKVSLIEKLTSLSWADGCKAGGNQMQDGVRTQTAWSTHLRREGR